jgi:hypothetical protein
VGVGPKRPTFFVSSKPYNLLKNTLISKFDNIILLKVKMLFSGALSFSLSLL